MKPPIKQVSYGVAVASALIALAGCGGDDGSKAATTKPSDKTAAATPPASGSTIALAADPSGRIAFDKKALSAKSGTTTIDFTNASEVPHAVEIEGKGVEKETKTIQGGKAALKVALKPGTYTFYCPVADHEEDGMKGVLTVK